MNTRIHYRSSAHPQAPGGSTDANRTDSPPFVSTLAARLLFVDHPTACRRRVSARTWHDPFPGSLTSAPDIHS